jgi:hypothetical protein
MLVGNYTIHGAVTHLVVEFRFLPTTSESLSKWPVHSDALAKSDAQRDTFKHTDDTTRHLYHNSHLDTMAGDKIPYVSSRLQSAISPP